MTVKGTPEEFAALVTQLQGRRGNGVYKFKIPDPLDSVSLIDTMKAIRDTFRDKSEIPTPHTHDPLKSQDLSSHDNQAAQNQGEDIE